MPLQPKGFDPRQEMTHPDYELQYKRDSYLKDVELHHHDFFEVYFLLSGDVTYLIENRICHVLPGDLLLISPRELHQVCIQPEMAVYERFVLWVDERLIRRMSSVDTDLYAGFDPTRPGHRNRLRLKPEDRTRIQSLMEQLYKETQQGGFGTEQLRQNLLSQLLIQINRLVDRDDSLYEEEDRASRAVSQVISFISLHYAEPISLEMLAERFYISKYHLSHEFNRQVGTSVYRFLQKKRLLIARQLMSQGQKPNAVYTACGFNDYTNFYRAFKAEYHISPRQYALSVQNRDEG